MSLTPAMVRAVVVRLAVAWVGLSLALFVIGPALFEALLPLLKFLVDLMQPELDASLRLVHYGHDGVIEMRPLIVHPIRIGDGFYPPGGVLVERATTELVHQLLPSALYLSALLAWPARRKQEWVGRLALAIPVTTILVLLSTSLFLAGQLELVLVMQREQAGTLSREPWLVTFLIFMESGGRWLLPVLAAVATISGVSALIGGTTAHAQPVATPAPKERIIFPPV